MNCPRCGALLKEGQMFCESCGMDLLLVPVYDPQVDAQMESARIGIAGDLADTQNIRPNIVKQKLEENNKLNEEAHYNPKQKKDDSDYGQKQSFKKKDRAEKETTEDAIVHERPRFVYIPYILFGIVCVIIILTIAVVLLSYKQEDKSYDYQVKKAETMCLEGDYQEMLVYAKNALNKAPNSSDAKMLIARAYEGLHEAGKEEDILREIILVDSSYVLAYDYLIPLLAQNKDFEGIAVVLQDCDVQSVLEKYVDYLCNAPDFSLKPGTYTNITTVKLIGAGGGQIFYSLDGSEPDNQSIHYITPIILDAGTYKLKACYYNPYGVKSDIAVADYVIHPESAGSPFVELESGYYKEPQFITVDSPDETYQIYYTTDGEDPTFESCHYVHPIPLPLGTSTYKFIMYNDQETPGDIVEVQYTFEPDVPISSQQASNLLLQSLISARIISDTQGHVDGMDGNRQYSAVSIIRVNTSLYFLFKEMYCSSDSALQDTGSEYAVDVSTGKSYVAEYSQENGYTISEIQ